MSIIVWNLYNNLYILDINYGYKSLTQKKRTSNDMDLEFCQIDKNKVRGIQACDPKVSVPDE